MKRAKIRALKAVNAICYSIQEPRKPIKLKGYRTFESIPATRRDGGSKINASLLIRNEISAE